MAWSNWQSCRGSYKYYCIEQVVSWNYIRATGWYARTAPLSQSLLLSLLLLFPVSLTDCCYRTTSTIPIKTNTKHPHPQQHKTRSSDRELLGRSFCSVTVVNFPPPNEVLGSVSWVSGNTRSPCRPIWQSLLCAKEERVKYFNFCSVSGSCLKQCLIK